MAHPAGGAVINTELQLLKVAMTSQYLLSACSRVESEQRKKATTWKKKIRY